MNVDSPSGPRDGRPHVGVRTGAMLFGLGALGVVLTSVLYAVAGPQAALPGASHGADAGGAATALAAAWMRGAGRVGMPSDVLVAVGASMLAGHARGRPGVQAGWLALALSGALFVVVDAMVALVLPSSALQGPGAVAYPGLRALFDALFAVGAWTLGVGVWSVAAARPLPNGLRRWLPWTLRALGGAGVAANSAYLLGAPFGAPLIGPVVALSALALCVRAGLDLWCGPVAAPPHPLDEGRTMRLAR